MLEGAGSAVQEAPVVSDPAPAVGGAQEAQAAGSGNELPKLPGWTGQLAKEQLAVIQDRVAKDPKALDELPKGLSELYASYDSLKVSSAGALKRPGKTLRRKHGTSSTKSLAVQNPPRDIPLRNLRFQVGCGTTSLRRNGSEEWHTPLA